jgi:hypothetical protein
VIIFRFPRDPITIDDKQVEFVTKLCGSGGFGRGGAPTSPPPEQQELKFELAPGAQRGGGGGGGTGGGGVGGINGGSGGMRGGNMGGATRPTDMPKCNYEVKKTFKLKPMIVKGELAL